MKRFSTYILLLIVLPTQVFFAQSDDYDGFKSEFYGGFLFHTSGWGGNLTYSKYLTDKSRSIFQVDFYSIRDQKETKVKKPRAKKFIFGKLYSVYSLDFNYGRKRIISYDYKNKGVEVALTYTIGPSLLFLKPEYVLVSDPTSQTPTLQRFNPAEHDLYNIYGGAPKLSGLSETTVDFGLNTKLGISFDFSPYRDFVRIIEVGFMGSYYASPFLIMDKENSKNFVPNLYFKFLFGSVKK